ncbi:aminotransferase class I/II-fold pyridoxal phosphate-dependent enzyme [Aldersonia sp. NBC_00410]|uniref:aminotransferase class I/II-fold pyridoxal phosphate-dependent enzyme n=1 Tax=Aldersonia sp. NBC_00410 TaxID=2975954 RepID=UPI0022510BF2|nr:aminotransferase class I/II-fold pyridoxal phosphate-dependent enzyme [Aldersonia sp. NBC_00410]MCX5044980.1 aminotransferase class I/II-fold pyridoxal phosphate-dependent enzyme [Aldersonia sp. NBC_00410]
MSTGTFDDTRPYTKPVQQRYELGLSENPYPPLPPVLDELNRMMAQVNRYPEFLPEQLPRVIGNRIGVGPEQIVVGGGATGVAMQIMQALIGSGEDMVFATPTFDGYPIMAGIAGVRATTVALDGLGRQDLWAMVRAIGPRTRVAVVCRPHNPTGTLVSASELQAFLAAVPRRVVVVLDEAYVEFLHPSDTLDVVRLIRRYPNVLVLRTFSKAYGLAGLRIGYAVAARELAARIRRWQIPFGMNAAAVAAVRASYAAEAELRERVRAITTEREQLAATLRRLGVVVPESHANFLYLDGPEIAPALRRAGIVAKSYPNGSARIAVGDPDAGRAVVAALLEEQLAGPGK